MAKLIGTKTIDAIAAAHLTWEPIPNFSQECIMGTMYKNHRLTLCHLVTEKAAHYGLFLHAGTRMQTKMYTQTYLSDGNEGRKTGDIRVKKIYNAAIMQES